jgi:hypothetical protein
MSSQHSDLQNAITAIDDVLLIEVTAETRNKLDLPGSWRQVFLKAGKATGSETVKIGEADIVALAGQREVILKCLFCGTFFLLAVPKGHGGGQELRFHRRIANDGTLEYALTRIETESAVNCSWSCPGCGFRNPYQLTVGVPLRRKISR